MMGDSVKRGIYILANDNVIEDTIALLNSLRIHAPSYPVVLIPYDDNHHKLAALLRQKYGVEKFEDHDLFGTLDDYARAILGRSSNMCRSFACWFGPFDDFIYIDVDIVVQTGQDDVFDLLNSHDLVVCADGHVLGIKEVFTERVLERELFTPEQISGLFNLGFIASTKRAMNYPKFIALLEEAILVKDIFIPQMQDQTILNFLAIKGMPRRANLRDYAPLIPDDAWAGIPTLKIKEGVIYKGDNQRVRNIHWAGFKVISERPYLDVWLRYRYVGRLVAIQRLAVKTKWRIQKLIRRGLAMNNPNWNTFVFQLNRFRRILRQRLS